MTDTPIKHKWWALAAVTLALAILFLDQTAVTVALPAMQQDFNATNTGIQWIVNAYLLGTACILLLGGKLGDLFGRRRVFLAGLFIFVAASIGTALAPTEVTAIIARGAQGVGAAFIIPTANVIIFSAFCSKTRGRAMGIQVGIASLFLSLGPVVGGFLTEYASWHMIFWINLPIGILTFFITLFSLPKDITPEKKPTIDWLGFFVSTFALFLIILGLMQTAAWGWADFRDLTMLGAGLFLCYIFIRIEKGKRHALVRLSLFKDKNFCYSSLLLLIVQTNFVARIFLTIYLQTVLSYSSATTGLMLLPGTLPILFIAPLNGYILDKVGERLPIIIGSFIISVSSLWIAISVWTYDYWMILPGIFIFTFGGPMVISSARMAALKTVPIKHRGMATGASNAARNVGGTLGVACMSSILFNLQRFRIREYLDKAGNTLKHLKPHELSGFLAGNEHVSSRVDHLNTTQLHALHAAVKGSFTFGYSAAMLAIAIVGLLGAYLGYKLPK